jgi:hypothetical protein
MCVVDSGHVFMHVHPQLFLLNLSNTVPNIWKRCSFPFQLFLLNLSNSPHVDANIWIRIVNPSWMPKAALQELSHWIIFFYKIIRPLFGARLIYQRRVEDRVVKWSEKVNYFTWPLLCGWWSYICLPWEGCFNHAYACAISNSQMWIVYIFL